MKIPFSSPCSSPDPIRNDDSGYLSDGLLHTFSEAPPAPKKVQGGSVIRYREGVSIRYREGVFIRYSVLRIFRERGGYKVQPKFFGQTNFYL